MSDQASTPADGSPRVTGERAEGSGDCSGPFPAQAPLPDVLAEIARRIEEARRRKEHYRKHKLPHQLNFTDGEEGALVSLHIWLDEQLIAAARAGNDPSSATADAERRNGGQP